MGIDLLIAYFAKQDEARRALRELARQGFSRTALVYKDADGDVHSAGPFLWRRALGVTLAGCLFGVIAALLLQWPQLLPGWRSSTFLALILACVIIGTLAVLLWLRLFRYGVEPGVIRNHARWLVSGESVLILQAPCESLPGPVALLRESGDIPPVLFFMHPTHERRAEVRALEVKLSRAQVLEHAQRHAREQQVDLRPQRSTELLKRFKRSQYWIRQVCADLSAASRLEQKSTPTAD